MDPKSDIKIESVETFASSDDFYCRCCFKMINSTEFIELSLELMAEMKVFVCSEIDFNRGSKVICEECQEIVQTLSRFRKEISIKQTKFSILVLSNKHKDLTKIQGKYLFRFN